METKLGTNETLIGKLLLHSIPTLFITKCKMNESQKKPKIVALVTASKTGGRGDVIDKRHKALDPKK